MRFGSTEKTVNQVVMEGYLLLLVHRLGPRRKIHLPGVMFNCAVIIAFPFVSFPFV